MRPDRTNGGLCPSVGAMKGEIMNCKNVIEQAVDRFLCWRLPEDFAPDGGITFDRNGHKYEPVGTNLLTAEQAKQMFLHCMPSYPELVVKEKAIRTAYNDLLDRAHFDESTPAGEKWHIMSILAELVQENKHLKEQVDVLNIINNEGPGVRA